MARQLPGPIGLAPSPLAFILHTCRASRGAASFTLLTARGLHMRSAKALPRGHAPDAD